MAWILIIGGSLAVVAGMVLLASVRPFQFRWRASDREMWHGLRHAGRKWDSSTLDGIDLQQALDDLRHGSPQLAAQLAHDLRQLREWEASKEDPYKDARQFTRILNLVGYLTIGLLLLGGAAVICGALWL